MKEIVCKSCGGEVRKIGEDYVCMNCAEKWSIENKEKSDKKAIGPLNEVELKKHIKDYVLNQKKSTLEEIKERYAACDQALVEKVVMTLYLRTEIGKIKEKDTVYYVDSSYANELHQRYITLIKEKNNAKGDYDKYMELAVAFERLGKYQDCEKYAEECRLQAEELDCDEYEEDDLDDKITKLLNEISGKDKTPTTSPKRTVGKENAIGKLKNGFFMLPILVAIFMYFVPVELYYGSSKYHDPMITGWDLLFDNAQFAGSSWMTGVYFCWISFISVVVCAIYAIAVFITIMRDSNQKLDLKKTNNIVFWVTILASVTYFIIGVVDMAMYEFDPDIRTVSYIPLIIEIILCLYIPRIKKVLTEK